MVETGTIPSLVSKLQTSVELWFTIGKYKAEEIYVLRMEEGREPGFNDGSL